MDLSAIQHSFEGKKVLVVDDTVDNQLLECVLLRKLGFEFGVASDGLQAIQMAMAGDYDAILMDLHMPFMDGIRATSELRKAGFKKPIIAVTADVQESTRSRAFEVGFNHFINKPLMFKDLLNSLIISFAQTAPLRIV